MSTDAKKPEYRYRAVLLTASEGGVKSTEIRDGRLEGLTRLVDAIKEQEEA
ncbi:MAG: hypothetical protein JRI34_00915 [Deltaproteobacteria bacterium]|nr:hypothetical protein [Deltaproteobacteria bacterium]